MEQFIFKKYRLYIPGTQFVNHLEQYKYILYSKCISYVSTIYKIILLLLQILGSPHGRPRLGILLAVHTLKIGVVWASQVIRKLKNFQKNDYSNTPRNLT